MTFEGTVIALTKVCPREEAGRPVSDIIIVLLVRFDPVVGRGLGSVDVHLLRGQRLARGNVVVPSVLLGGMVGPSVLLGRVGGLGVLLGCGPVMFWVNPLVVTLGLRLVRGGL